MWLEVLSGEDAGRVVEVTGSGAHPFVLGRVQGSELVIRDSRASRRHAALVPEAGGGLRLEDLGSANGTRVDGERVSTAVLHGGEVLEIGGVRIAVLVTPPPVTGALATATATPAPAPAPPAPRAVPGSLHALLRRRWPPAALGVAAGALAVILLMQVAAGEEEQAPDVVRDVAPATVLVEARRDRSTTAGGSGWVAAPGQVVTAAHVVNQGASFVVRNGAQRRRASVLAAAPCEDLAVLQVPRWEGGARLRLSESGDVEQGETVLALGYPAGAGPRERASSTRGVVSAARTVFRDPAPDVPAYPEAIRTDTALDPGFSGGPLVDLDGRVVGVNAAARTTGEDGRPLQGANYAIASDRARRVLEALRAGRSRAWIGANFGYPSPADLASRQLPEGLYLLGAVAGSPAALAHLGGRGELLTAVNGRAVGRTLAGWCAATQGIGSGDRVDLTVRLPDGRSRTVSLRFG